MYLVGSATPIRTEHDDVGRVVVEVLGPGLVLEAHLHLHDKVLALLARDGWKVRGNAVMPRFHGHEEAEVAGEGFGLPLGHLELPVVLLLLALLPAAEHLAVEGLNPMEAIDVRADVRLDRRLTFLFLIRRRRGRGVVIVIVLGSHIWRHEDEDPERGDNGRTQAQKTHRGKKDWAG